MMLPRIFRRQGDRPRAGRRPLVESLEGRQLLTTFHVTNLNNVGAGSLRQAIIDSNATRGTAKNTIAFNIPGSGVQTIKLAWSLPPINHPVVIDAATQPGYAGTPLVKIDGINAGSIAAGLNLRASSSAVNGLAVVNFALGGVLIDGASGDQITNDRIQANGYGVTLQNGGSLNTISGDVISGNTKQGVVIAGAFNNTVRGNVIGAAAGGTAALGNGYAGVLITSGSGGNVIGGTSAGAANTIAANGGDGISIQQGSYENLVQGNFIGTTTGGTAALGNRNAGVEIGNGSSRNTIGGAAAGAGNTVAANAADGVFIWGGRTSGNAVLGNFIGTNSAGATNLGNGGNGVEIWSGAFNNTIGGAAAGAGNTISHNRDAGVELNSAGRGNVFKGGVINANGFKRKTGPYGDGVYIYNTSGTSVTGCTINSNRGWGILLIGSAATTLSGNTLSGNGLGGVHSG